MDDKLIERINQFNKIKYGSNDNETRIVFATLKPNNGYTWKQEADDMIEEYNTRGVTTAPKHKE
jgi:hypothetical protein